MRSDAIVAALALLLAASGAHAQTRGEPPVPTLGGTPAPPPIRIERPTSPGADPIAAQVARQQHDQVRRELQALEQRQQSLERTLTTPDRERLRPQLLELDAQRQRANAQLRDLDVELARPEPNADLVRARREQLERDIQRIEREYDALRSP